MSSDAPAPARDSTDIPPPPDREAPRPPPGQLGTFALLGAAIGTVPLPWIPVTLAQYLRGALVQDIAARHGLALTPEARAVLADPLATKMQHATLAQAFAYLGRKLLARFGRLAVLPPLRAALETYVLGYLFDRYLARAARTGGRRVEESEARAVRQAIERAVLRVVGADGRVEWPTVPVPPEESRDEVTRALDGLLSATTTVPSWLLLRLGAAFDAALAQV